MAERNLDLLCRLIGYKLVTDLTPQEENDLCDLMVAVPTFTEEQIEIMMKVSPRLLAKYCHSGNIPWPALKVAAKIGA